jgi:hypothetical protein
MCAAMQLNFFFFLRNEALTFDCHWSDACNKLYTLIGLINCAATNAMIIIISMTVPNPYMPHIFHRNTSHYASDPINEW